MAQAKLQLRTVLLSDTNGTVWFNTADWEAGNILSA